VVWPSIAAATPGMSATSQKATRLHRHVLELLSEAKKDKNIRASAGALRLVAELCRSQTWPDNHWPSVLQALEEADSFAREADAAAVTHTVSRAFIDDLLEAAAAVLRYTPSAFIPKVMPFLTAADAGLQAAAAARLQDHKGWGPQKRDDTAGSSDTVLKQLEILLQEGEGGTPALPSSEVASCADIVFAVLSSVIGPDLTAELWAVESAFEAFLAWVVADGESPLDEDVEALDLAVAEQGATSSRKRTMSSQSATSTDLHTSVEMPQECRRRCVAALAAWELLLLGVQNAEQAASAVSPPKCGDEVAPTAPPELLAMALQLKPEQIAGAGAAAHGWAIGKAPPLPDGCSPLRPLLQLLCVTLTCDSLVGEDDAEMRLAVVLGKGKVSTGAPDCDVFALSARVLLLALRAVPAAVRSFWEQLPRRRDRDLIERLVAKSFSPALVQAEAASAARQLETQQDKLGSDLEAVVMRRPKQLVLQLTREDVKAELCVQLPDSFPLRTATAEQPEKMPGIPIKRVRNWMLQARQVLNGPRPMGVGRVMLMWARSFALFFDGVEDCPICYNVVHLTTQTIPRKPCPTCKHKFHSECLYHWFKTSAKTTCPLCNQPF